MNDPNQRQRIDAALAEQAKIAALLAGNPIKSGQSILVSAVPPPLPSSLLAAVR
jgi:hypothetical protein